MAGIDCDELLEKKRILKDNEKKYQAMLDINKLSEEVYENNGESLSMMLKVKLFPLYH